ncbi:ABC1 family-domain-containing protein [Gilbertella persicaria]|uniref:ABC1 family-domain-containing protein n=1 Tax=Gilbertella persicaria TaxID=101096 RepID=UPI00221FBBE5|nr:ABC1 family-domain-containing protein [Gilbertella persicaria]KAI8097969.1 ABC1 family-domain-containing protein [Gilbertella persicaria]
MYRLKGLTACLSAATVGFTWHESDTQARHIALALQRVSVASDIGIRVALDYKWTELRSHRSEQDQIEAKQQCHQRCADRVLIGLQKLGGIYVKLGQHVSAMTYILPDEWTRTLSALQDRCEPSLKQDIEDMFFQDYGYPMDYVFEEFDWHPLGVASLAQVHKAKLRHGNRDWVAVKFQHPRLDEFCRIDLQTVSFIIHSIKRIFPEFGFEWILQEMQESLPQEMNFEREAANAAQLEQNFAHYPTALVVPKVIWAKRRILCMEFIQGARIDDLEFMLKHGIDSSNVSTEITEIFSKMMFIDGFVHCDPHPGNILIRPAKDPQSKFNFDLVLLDHGLYRTLPDQLRTDYAHLWTSLIRGDEEGIRTYALRVGCTDHRLFASLLTGREWSTIQAADLSSDRTETEVSRVTGRAKHFVIRIYDILETLPRVVLLLLKTSDLLRGLDESLRKSEDKYMTYALTGKFCAEAVWMDAKANLLERIHTSGWWDCLVWIRHLIRAWWEYQSLEVGLWAYRFQSNTREKWALIWHRGTMLQNQKKRLEAQKELFIE